jgi:transcription antitermination factor NusG
MNSLMSSEVFAAGHSLTAWETPYWYAVYTRSRHEHKVKIQLDDRGIENFLPLYKRISQWKDRRKEIQTPLFPGYVFVRIPLLEKLEVLKTHGAVYLVRDGQFPLSIPEESIFSVRRFVEEGLKCDPHPYLRIGQKVRIVDGPLSGIEGILVRKKNQRLLVVSIDLIQRSVSVEIETWRVERV